MHTRLAFILSFVLALLAFSSACEVQPNTPELSIEETPSPGFRVVFIDVGQGDAQLVTVAGHNLLIDAGRDGDLILARLRSFGVKGLDAVVATHPDADHTGGLAAVLRKYAVERIYVNGDDDATKTYADFLQAAKAEPGAQVVRLQRGQKVPLGDMSLGVLNPAFATGDTNNDSIVLRLACGPVSVLFTADAEQPAEASMLAAGLVEHATVLKVGHHGSKTSSSLPFIRAVNPEVAIISAGRVNDYGHPAPSTIANLAALGTKFEFTDTTAKDDSVTMTSDCETYSFSRPPEERIPAATATALVTATPRTTKPVSPSPIASLANTPVASSGNFELPACYQPGKNSCNCSDFSTRSYAQWFHDTYDPTDINRMDGNKDGKACETLPP